LPPDAHRWFSSLTFEDPNERLGVSERVVDWMMIVLRPSQPFPLEAEDVRKALLFAGEAVRERALPLAVME